MYRIATGSSMVSSITNGFEAAVPNLDSIFDHARSFCSTMFAERIIRSAMIVKRKSSVKPDDVEHTILASIADHRSFPVKAKGDEVDFRCDLVRHFVAFDRHPVNLFVPLAMSWPLAKRRPVVPADFAAISSRRRLNHPRRNTPQGVTLQCVNVWDWPSMSTLKVLPASSVMS